MKFFPVTGLALLLLVTTVPALAAYQTEAGIDYSRTRTNAPGSSHDSGLGVDLTWHFQPVDTDDVPLAEATFLNRSSSVHASYVQHNHQHYDAATVGFEVWAKWLYLYDNYSQTMPDTGPDQRNFNLRAGARLTDQLLVYVGALDGDNYLQTRWQTGFKYVATPNVQYFTLQGNANRSLKGTAIERYTDIAFSTGWYPTDALGLSLDYGHSANPLDKTTSTGGGIDHFFWPNFRTSLEYRQTRHLATDVKDKTFNLRLALRF